MPKLTFAIIVVVIIGIIGFFVFRDRLPAVPQTKVQILGNSTDEKFASVEDSLTTLKTQVDYISTSAANLGKNTSDNALFATAQDRISSLEALVASLQERVTKLEQNPAKTIQVQSKKAPLYIPLVTNASSQALDWQTQKDQEVAINPNDYPGYTSIQLEAGMRVYQGNGKAFARIIEINENLPIYTSEISTESQNYTLVTSSGFQLPSDKKTYRIQLRSLTGYAAEVQNARIRVNF